MPYIDQIKVGSVTRDLQDTGARANEGTLANLTTTEKSNLVGAINEVNAAASDLKSRMNAVQIITQAGPSPIAHIADGSANNAKGYDIQIVPQQAGSGDPSPENVRTITGFTGTTVTRTDGQDPPGTSGTYSIAFPSSAGTVYGGSLHVDEDGSGTLTVDRAFATFDGTEAWSAPNENYFALFSNPESIDNNDLTQISNWLIGGGNAYQQYGNFRVQTNGALCVGNKTNNVGGTITLEQLKTKLAQTPLQVCYKLATPSTYTLTAPQIALLYGVNNVFADTGDMAVEYIADTKLYIQTLTGHPDEDMTADANIASGKFFMVGNKLFISTSAIASGETIVPGTNCTETNLAAALNTINAD